MNVPAMAPRYRVPCRRTRSTRWPSPSRNTLLRAGHEPCIKPVHARLSGAALVMSHGYPGAPVAPSKPNEYVDAAAASVREVTPAEATLPTTMATATSFPDRHLP